MPEEPAVSNEMKREIAGAIAELDLKQIAILRTLTPAQRAQQAASMIEASEQVTAWRLRQRQPDLAPEEALRIVRGGLFKYVLQQTNHEPT